jgi:hypothetical protein
VPTSAPAPLSSYAGPASFALPANREPGLPGLAGFAVPEQYAPPRQVVPDFPPIRIRRRGLRRLLPPAPRLRRGPLALGLAVATAVLAVSAGYRPPPERAAAVGRPAPEPAAARPAHDVGDDVVRAPVRIADAGAVRLLRPGDRVDVLAAARVVASAVTVVAVPEQSGGPATGIASAGIAEGGMPPGASDAGGTGGALVVLAVPRRVAAALSGAAASTLLTVTLC